MRKLDPNPSWKYGYKYNANHDSGAVCLYIRNGVKMSGTFMTPEEAIQLAKELVESAENAKLGNTKVMEF